MLTPYRRGKTWWAKGRVEYNGRAITEYIRESTGASSESGARDWIEERTAIELRRHIVGEERALSFNDALLLYQPTRQMARYLIPVAERFGSMPVVEITPKMVRELGRILYPKNCTDSWRRWVITPVRAVINNAHELGKCPPIRIAGYTREERIKQDRVRGKRSRVERKPGDWQWLLRFCEHAGPYHSALALFMFATGARIGQSVAMRPAHLDLQNAKVTIPGAKGHDDRTLTLPMELVVTLANLPPKTPRGWKRTKANKRVFGFASKDGPRKGWATACRRAGIEYIPPHSAGRHGFGQEFNIRNPVDEKAAGAFGGWKDTGLMRRTYTHAEDFEAKIHGAFRTGLVQAEEATGLKLLKERV
ncbi:MAG TPA: tyrosine-type recombinase/integrase [Woeseiaceae bacterium]